MFYMVVMINNITKHIYTLGIYDTMDIAKEKADKEKKRKNNRYEYDILETNKDKSIFITAYSSMLN